MYQFCCACCLSRRWGMHNQNISMWKLVRHVIWPQSNSKELNIPAANLCLDINVSGVAPCIIHINSKFTSSFLNAFSFMPLWKQFSETAELGFLPLSQGYSVCILYGCCSVLRPYIAHDHINHIGSMPPSFIPTFFFWRILRNSHGSSSLGMPYWCHIVFC